VTLGEGLLLSAAAFLGSHFVLSHPLRGPLVRALGERLFQAVYSLIALATLGLMVYFYHAIGRQPPLWGTTDVLWVAASLLMWFASILLVGSFVKNPALPGAAAPVGGPANVFRITRHPAMWAFAIWAVIHAAVVATPKALVLDGAILILSLGGAAGQDLKKRKLMGQAWQRWTTQTSFIPFARGFASPGAFAAVGGTLLFFLATWLHPIGAGFWRWIG
jgi:uncharacterized membrane protein